jgi:hypothetical protein
MKIYKKKSNIHIFRLANKVIYNLNKLLTDKSLSKEKINIIRNNTVFIYKVFINEYNTLPKKYIRKTIYEKIQISNIKTNQKVSQVVNKIIMTVNVHSVKLKRDINLKYFYAMLEK